MSESEGGGILGLILTIVCIATATFHNEALAWASQYTGYPGIIATVVIWTLIILGALFIAVISLLLLFGLLVFVYLLIKILV